MERSRTINQKGVSYFGPPLERHWACNEILLMDSPDLDNSMNQ